MQPSGRSRSRLPGLAALALLGALLAPAAVAVADSLDSARARVAAARAAADEAARRFDEAENEYYALDREITRARAGIETTRTYASELQVRARGRAVEAYKKGAVVELVELVADRDVLAAARRTELLDRVNADGNEAVDELGAVNQELRVREATLADRLDRQRSVLDQIEARRAELSEALVGAQRALTDLQARLARQSARASFTSGGSSGSAGTVIASGSWVCPVQGATAFGDTWGAPRSGGRRHEGVDMMSPFGVPVVAVVSGTFTQSQGSLQGLGAWLRGSDGNSYFYAHLRDYVGGSRSVAAGELIGHVGDTGNARGTPHLHFEFHPGGGSAVNPYPTVRAHC